jgi:hypothetical protein
MASRSAPSRRASVPTTHTDPLDSMEFKFSHENRPNAEVLLPSLRLSGYNLESAIGDLADNPLDAGADLIVITLNMTSALIWVPSAWDQRQQAWH